MSDRDVAIDPERYPDAVVASIGVAMATISALTPTQQASARAAIAGGTALDLDISQSALVGVLVQATVILLRASMTDEDAAAFFRHALDSIRRDDAGDRMILEEAGRVAGTILGGDHVPEVH